MRIQLYEVFHGDCPYLPNRTWVTHTFQVPRFDPSMYERLISEGWRRSGAAFYQNHCPGCNLCIPIRIPVDRFAPSKSQRRVLRRNADVTIERRPIEPLEEVYELYSRYNARRHDPEEEVTFEAFRSFLGTSPIDTDMMLYHVDDRLVGVGWIDVLPTSLSSVYYAFDPEESQRSLGTFSVLKEIELSHSLGKLWHHLGFYVPGCHKMDYKSRFTPHQLLINGEWREPGD
ncbi:MAG: arginyltransferase [Spirochaetaceae bacterium]